MVKKEIGEKICGQITILNVTHALEKACIKCYWLRVTNHKTVPGGIMEVVTEEVTSELGL